MPLKIKELPESERPYEKLKMYGANCLSNAELLAIIIKSGTKNETSIDIANRVLKLAKNLNGLRDLSIIDFKKIKGIGEVNAIQIEACIELSKRLLVKNDFQYQIKSAKDVYEMVSEEMSSEKQEILKVLVLNNKNYVTKVKDIVKGETNFAKVSIKQILAENIKSQEPKLIMIHNHPSGDSNPSQSDIEITEKTIEACELMGIELLDHVVIGRDNYKSILSMKCFNNT